jgi:Rv2525c-like, glycoside hydrolase-like domain
VRRLAVLGAVIAVAALAAACLPPAPQPTATTTTTTTTVKPATVHKAFDACAAPSTTTMNAWMSKSPYTSVGVYIGGANRGCAQPNLTASWINTVWSQGWKLLPIWVGPQAPCTTLSNTTKITSDPSQAYSQGAAQANAAADAAIGLGLAWAPIYYDMEAYPRGGTCSQSIVNFTEGWVRTLNYRGYSAAMYSSLCSGILDQAASAQDPAHSPLNAIWIAAWNNTPNIYGFTGSCALSDLQWNQHQRVHQYIGGHNEAYGGVTINIDTNAVDGPTVPQY